MERLHTVLAVLTVSGLILQGCATHPARPTYRQAVLNRPLPTTSAARMHECTWIRSEIARQQSLAAYGSATATTPFMALAYRSVAARRIAALESRAADIQCTAAFSNVVVAPSPQETPAPEFQRCFARCQKYTDRTKDQCFDACNTK